MQIKLHRVRGSNIMAYGDFDFILDEETVYQLAGKNGSGKSSLPVIIEEILYNSNSRGIKKPNLANRFTDVKGWWGEVTFFIGNDEYILNKTVKTTAKVSLTKNGEDIGGHTATQTYKIVKEILGDMDFKTFSKLVYQSPKSSMDFLTATDANRKKFLVGLLGLERYGEIETQLKDILKDAKTELTLVLNPINNIQKWLSSTMVPSQVDCIDIPEFDSSMQDALDELRIQHRTIDLENQKVDTHNNNVATYNKRRNELEKLCNKERELKALDVAPAIDLSEKITKITSELAVAQEKMNSEKRTYQTFKAAAGKTQCHVCKSQLDVSQQEIARDASKERFILLKPERDRLQKELDLLQEEQEKFAVYKSWKKKVDAVTKSIESFELGDEPDGDIKCKTDASELSCEIKELQVLINKCKTDIKNAEEQNTKAKINNARRDEIIKQHEQYEIDLNNLNEKLDIITEEVAELEMLVQAFSSKGLISYKIESNVKVFEELINNYLSVFTNGQFALGFVLDGSKLKVVIYDMGIEVGMESLSTGEENKVNISTLLAIRNLMSTINSVELNLLFLDEIVSFLDTGALDTLVEIMLKETHLNTFLVSHGYEHPLTKSIKLEKKNGKTEVVNG